MAKTKARRVYRVVMGQAWKDELPIVVRSLGGKVARGWRYTDDSTTEISIDVLWAGTAAGLQRALWSKINGPSIGVTEVRR